MGYLGWFAFAALMLSTVATLGKDDKTQADPLLNFVVGDYVIVGREPDGGATYSGTARVESREGGLLLTDAGEGTRSQPSAASRCLHLPTRGAFCASGGTTPSPY